jgi:hypothetical protein
MNQLKTEKPVTWKPQFFGSGTCIVTSLEAKKPHLYVYGPRNDDDGQCQRDRMKMCYQLADFLNGGDRPAWLDDMERRSEDACDDLDGSSIRATGPSIDRNPPALDWWEDGSDEANSNRARLMDRLFL